MFGLHQKNVPQLLFVAKFPVVDGDTITQGPELLHDCNTLLLPQLAQSVGKSKYNLDFCIFFLQESFSGPSPWQHIYLRFPLFSGSVGTLDYTCINPFMLVGIIQVGKDHQVQPSASSTMFSTEVSSSASSTHFLSNSRDGDATSSLFQCLEPFPWRFFILRSNLNILWCSLRPLQRFCAQEGLGGWMDPMELCLSCPFALPGTVQEAGEFCQAREQLWDQSGEIQVRSQPR